MNQSSTQIKEILFDCLNAMSENPWIYTDQNNLFSRKRKISFSDAILSTICMQRSSSKEEILKYYDFMTNAPTHSALIQQRNKLKPSAFEDLFYRFTNVVTPDLRYKGYRLFAVDGSDIYIPRNPNDPDTYRISDVYGKGFNMLHLNAAYDLVSKLFTDIIIQPVNHINEYNAMCDMIDRYAQLHSEEKAIFIADRGFTSFNVFAHAIENGVFFLIRGREPSPRSMLSTLDLPDEPEFEIIFERWLTRRNTNTITFRIVKLLLPDGSAEYIYTNLPKEEFTLDEIRELYNRRWGIETSFRDIKYAAGMLFFHSRKKQLVLQEIYAKLILYNFSEAVTGGIVLQKRKGKMQYSINFTTAISLCVEFIRRNSNREALFELDDLISRHLVPVRPGRSSPRYIRARTATSFLYR